MDSKNSTDMIDLVRNMIACIVDTACPSLDNKTLLNIALNDALTLKQKNAEYADSWKKRGGVDTYFMLCRKWDRIEAQVERNGYNILDLATADTRDEGLLDDIADLRRYLTLVEHEVLMRDSKEPIGLDNASGARANRQRQRQVLGSGFPREIEKTSLNPSTIDAGFAQGYADASADYVRQD